MRLPASSLLLTMITATTVALSFAFAVSAGGCSDPTTLTPICTENVDQDGIHPVAGGCEGFAVCAVNPSSPAACCVTADGGALPDSDRASCLYGYGACAALLATTDAKGNTTYVCSSTYDGGGTGGGGSGGGDAGSD